MASSVIQTVRLPRLTSAASYSGQFVTRYLALGILWRRLSLNLYGMDLTRMERRVTVPPQRQPCHPLRLQPAAAIAQPVVYSCTNALWRPPSLFMSPLDTGTVKISATLLQRLIDTFCHAA